MAQAASTSHKRLAPDLARLPITHNARALSVAEGVRAALSVCVIIVASEYFDLPALRTAALGALWTCLCDPGGPVRRRVPALLSFTVIGGLIMGGFGLLRGLGPEVALPIGVLALFAASFVRVYGQAPQQVGALLGFAVILSLDRALSVPEAVQTGASFAFGALWATLLTLVIWRLYPYRAARQAVAEIYHALAALTDDLYRLVRNNTAEETTWEAHARAHRRPVRDAIEAARAAVLDILRGRGAGSLRASQNLIRLETGDQIFGALIALSDLLERGSSTERRAAERILRRMRPLLSLLADVALSDTPAAHPGIKRSIAAMEAEIARLPLTDPLRPIADRLTERLRIAQTLTVPANYPPDADPDGGRALLLQRVLSPLRANLTWRSPTLRHALRAAVMAAPALAFTLAWFTPYDHWLTITIVATMQPFFALTYARALERIAGTALGGIVAAAVGLICTTPMAIALAMFPLTVAALSVRAVNFGLYMLALTPVVVLLVETGEPDTSEWRIAAARAGFTFAGGLLAVAASFLLWPGREPERLVQSAKDTIAAHGRFADATLACLLNEISAGAVETARREAGIASNVLEASINRALIERGGGGRDMLEAVLVIDAASRRCAGRLSAMRFDTGPRTALAPDSLRAWRDWIGGSMRSLAAGQSELTPRPDTGATDALRRLAGQIELMGGAMRRLTEG
jgi:uncharacterized membrane protein YccC